MHWILLSGHIIKIKVATYDKNISNPFLVYLLYYRHTKQNIKVVFVCVTIRDYIYFFLIFILAICKQKLHFFSCFKLNEKKKRVFFAESKIFFHFLSLLRMCVGFLSCLKQQQRKILFICCKKIVYNNNKM